MIYSLNKKYFGTSNTEKISEVDASSDIIDLCYVKDFGFFFLIKNDYSLHYVDLSGGVHYSHIGASQKNVSRDGSKEYALFNAPSSMMYSERLNVLFVIEDGGKQIRKVEIPSFYVSSLLNGESKKSVDHYYSKINTRLSETNGAINANGVVYWVNNILNRCLMFDLFSVSNMIGIGHAGYSVCSDIKRSLLNSPCGISFFNGAIYIADTGNHCIRKIENNKIFLVAGSPTKNDLTRPRKVRIKNNIGYFIDENLVKYLSMPGYQVGTAYESKNIAAIEIINKDLFVVENI